MRPTPDDDLTRAVELRKQLTEIGPRSTTELNGWAARADFILMRLVAEIERLRSASVWDDEGLCIADPCILPPGHDGECQR